MPAWLWVSLDTQSASSQAAVGSLEHREDLYKSSRFRGHRVVSRFLGDHHPLQPSPPLPHFIPGCSHVTHNSCSMPLDVTLSLPSASTGNASPACGAGYFTLPLCVSPAARGCAFPNQLSSRSASRRIFPILPQHRHRARPQQEYSDASRRTETALGLPCC